MVQPALMTERMPTTALLMIESVTKLPCRAREEGGAGGQARNTISKQQQPQT